MGLKETGILAGSIALSLATGFAGGWGWSRFGFRKQVAAARKTTKAYTTMVGEHKRLVQERDAVINSNRELKVQLDAAKNERESVLATSKAQYIIEQLESQLDELKNENNVDGALYDEVLKAKKRAEEELETLRAEHAQLKSTLESTRNQVKLLNLDIELLQSESATA